jgi:hypothetical protein
MSQIKRRKELKEADVETERAAYAQRETSPGTQFTCATGTKVQILTLQGRERGCGCRDRASGVCAE